MRYESVALRAYLYLGYFAGQPTFTNLFFSWLFCRTRRCYSRVTILTLIDGKDPTGLYEGGGGTRSRKVIWSVDY